jgi:hypothetical protein
LVAYIKIVVVIILFILFFASCKKETTITVKVFNPALNEYVANATVVLLESKSSNCTEIASGTTDNNGAIVFSKEKLHTSSSYKYYFGVKESWGITHESPCGTITLNYVDVGKTQEIMLTDYVDTQYKLQINNALSPSITGDSLICGIEQSYYCGPVYNHCQGGGVGGSILTHDLNYPMTSLYIGPVSAKLFANRLIVKTRKRKMGVVTTSIDTVRMHPYNGAVTIVQVNW